MMTHDEIIAVVQAHKEGKPLEWFSARYRWELSEQVSLEAILHEITNNKTSYRVAPEPPKPKYVPFAGIEDFMPCYDKLIKPKKGWDARYKAVSFDSMGVVCNANYYSYDQFYLYFEFADGTPCGKLVEK